MLISTIQKFLCSAILLLLVTASFSQITAITQTGEEVILNPDGTWKFISDTTTVRKALSLDTIESKKSPSSTFLVKSERVNCGIWMNPKLWKFKKNEASESSEYTFSLIGEDAYAMLICEKIQIPLDNLKEIAIQNAKEVAPDLVVENEQARKVNGLNLYSMQMDGTLHGIKFTYFGYYYSSEEGSVQFVGYTSQKLFNKYKPVLESLLNGFVLLDN